MRWRVWPIFVLLLASSRAQTTDVARCSYAQCAVDAPCDVATARNEVIRAKETSWASADPDQYEVGSTGRSVAAFHYAEQQLCECFGGTPTDSSELGTACSVNISCYMTPGACFEDVNVTSCDEAYTCAKHISNARSLFQESVLQVTGKAACLPSWQACVFRDRVCSGVNCIVVSPCSATSFCQFAASRSPALVPAPWCAAFVLLYLWLV